MLKFLYKKNHLSFVNDLVAHEEDYTISGQMMEGDFDKLYKAGKMEELKLLLLYVIDKEKDSIIVFSINNSAWLNKQILGLEKGPTENIL